METEYQYDPDDLAWKAGCRERATRKVNRAVLPARRNELEPDWLAFHLRAPEYVGRERGAFPGGCSIGRFVQTRRWAAGSRRRVCWSVLVLAVLLGCGDVPEAKSVPSILLVTVDTTRADHLGAYGYGRPTSPTLDQMAREGILVERAITTMPTTDPAHLSILTGQYPRTHGVRRNGVSAVPGLENLASWASSLGHSTAAFVSRQHVKPSELGLEGFDYENGPDAPQREGGATLRRALAWLDAHAGEPWFVWVHFFDPHAPYAPPDRWARHVGPASIEEAPQVQRSFQANPEQTVLAYFTQLYDGEIAYMDSLVARLWEQVRAEKPLIVVAGDHGEYLGELWERHRVTFGHGRFLYGGNLHVPTIMWWGDRMASRRVEGLVGLVDIPATIFDLLGEEGFGTPGVSFHETNGKRQHGRAYAFSERRELDEEKLARSGLPERQFAVRDGRHSLIVSYPGETTELYDLEEDAVEQKNIAQSRPETVAVLREALDRWIEETPDTGASAIDSNRLEALRALGYVE